MKGITVLFEDDEILAINKPSGLAVQGGAGIGVSLDVLLASERDPAPLLVHRLDKETSGIILTAKTRPAAAKYALFFREGRLEKKYLGVCAGAGTEKGRIRTELDIRGKPKAAQTDYRFLASGTLGEGGICSLLELELATGRTHQIRRHLAGLGFPLLGDGKYGDFTLNKSLKKNMGLRRLLLHAFSLRLPGGLVIRAPLPGHFIQFLDRAGIGTPLP
ncbi:MAG: RluA family pseudouridine synthase [Treponema sp.]|jgi:23S rRNA pseudouridine955/2504/2580 synthase|nr:RluA family pseudouridine synthase [Treponema sp.]